METLECEFEERPAARPRVSEQSLWMLCEFE